MIQHVGPGREDRRERGVVAFAVGDQQLDRGFGTLGSDRVDGRREHRGTAVGQVVARDACDHDVRETERADCVGHAARLVGVDRERLARVDLAEPARARAAVTEDHECRRAIRPAFVDVRAAGLLAHGVQVEITDEPLEPEVLVVEPGAHLHPLRAPRRRIDFRMHARLGQAAEQPNRYTGGSRAREGCHVVGDRTPCHVLAVDGVMAEPLDESREDPVDDSAHLGRGPEEPRHRRDAAVPDAARDDVVEHREVGIDVERETVARPAPRHAHADRRDLLVADPHAGVPGRARRIDAEVGQRGNQHRFEPADVRDDIALTGAPLGERDDRIADELTRPVIRDVAPAIRVDELGTDRRRVAQHMGEIGARPEGVHVRMLLQQQIVVGCALVDRALQRLGLPVRNQPEPARVERLHASSGSQSRVSRTVRTSLRNEAA